MSDNAQIYVTVLPTYLLHIAEGALEGQNHEAGNPLILIISLQNKEQRKKPSEDIFLKAQSSVPVATSLIWEAVNQHFFPDYLFAISLHQQGNARDRQKKNTLSLTPIL